MQSVVIGFRLTKPYVKRLTQLARVEGRTLSAYIRRAVERQIEAVEYREDEKIARGEKR